MFRNLWKHSDHINILEARTILNGLRRQARSTEGLFKRHLVLSDSQISIVQNVITITPAGGLDDDAVGDLGPRDDSLRWKSTRE